MAQMNVKHAKGLNRIEKKLASISFISVPWTPQNGSLPAANTLNCIRFISVFAKGFKSPKLLAIVQSLIKCLILKKSFEMYLVI